MCQVHGTRFHDYAYTINNVHNSYSTKYLKHASYRSNNVHNSYSIKYPKHALYRSKDLAFHTSKNFIYSHILSFFKFLNFLHVKLLRTFQPQENKSCPFSLLKSSKIII